MGAWTNGYVAESEYTPGFYSVLTPSFLSLPVPQGATPIALVVPPELWKILGSGRGYSVRTPNTRRNAPGADSTAAGGSLT
jgi:hypothetical protein